MVAAASCLYGVVLPSAGASDRPSKFDTHAVDFAISFKGERAAYQDLSTFVLPGATLSIEAIDGPPGDYTFCGPEDHRGLMVIVQHGKVIELRIGPQIDHD